MPWIYIYKKFVYDSFKSISLYKKFLQFFEVLQFVKGNLFFKFYQESHVSFFEIGYFRCFEAT
jgi:hypothetical protein